MFSNNEFTEGLLIAVFGANFVLLFFIAWHVATARLYLRQVRRLAKAITGTVRKMDYDELIDEMLSCSGEQQRYEITAGDNLASPATPGACSGGTAGQQPLLRNDEVTSQSRQKPAVPDRVHKYRERLDSVAAGGQAGRYGLHAHGKALTASNIEELDDSEIERLYARYEARLGAAMTKRLGLQRSSFMRRWYLCFSRSRPKTNQGLLLTSRATRLCHLRAIPSLWHFLSTADGSVDHN